MTLYIVLGLIVLIGIYIMFKSKGKASYNEVTAEELKSMMNDKNTVLIDVRTPKEIRQGVIGKPLEIELGPSMKNAFSSLDKDKNYVVYCRSGRRSALACSTMTGMGFKNVNNLVGGILAYKS